MAGITARARQCDGAYIRHSLLCNVGAILLAHVDKGVHLVALHDLQVTAILCDTDIGVVPPIGITVVFLS